MKLLFHHRIASRDGQSVHMDELITALRQRGHDVVVVGPRQTAGLAFGGQAGLVARLKRTLPRTLYEVLEMAYNVPAYWRLRRAVRHERPAAVYERFNLFAIAGALYCRRHGIPLLLEVNAPLYEERRANRELALHRLARWTQHWVWRQADHVLPVTRVLGDTIADAGVPQSRILVVPNGIAPERFAHVPDTAAAKQALGLTGRLVLGFTGFVRAWHDLDRVLDLVAARVAGSGPEADLHLLLVGDGPARRTLEERARTLGIADRLTITGIIGRDDIARYIAAFDIALQPGVTPYASPLKLFEYMVLGRAIIAPDAANIREVLDDDVNAVLFDTDDPHSFAAALHKLCTDDALRRRLGAEARRTIDTGGFLWTHNADRIIALLRPDTA